MTKVGPIRALFGEPLASNKDGEDHTSPFL